MRTLSGRLLALLTITASALSHSQQPLIQHVEPIQIAAQPGLAEFDAYGRRFSLELSTNDRLLAKLPARRKAEISQVRVLRGRLAGQPDSWVRLTAFGGRVEGAIWDGRDLYAVGRYADLARALTTPLPVSPDQTVLFRLSDTLNVFPQNFCAVGEKPGAAAGSSALDLYKSLVGELQMRALAVPVTRQMDIALIADREFQESEIADVAGAMLARLNVADGIFADQVGLLLNAAQVQLVPLDNDPFTTNEPEGLLDQVSAYRAANQAARSQAIAHLVTGKSLTGTTLGIAAVGGVCSVDDGVSLSDGRLGSFFSGLIMTHEIGHNLGAEHDGATGSACEAVGSGYIMWPSLNSAVRQFSQCSVTTMQQAIAGSTCLTSASVADATLTLSPSVAPAELLVPMTVTANVVSAGANLVQGVNISFNIPAALNATAIAASSGTCTLTPKPKCVLGDMPSGEQQTVTITATPIAMTLQALVTAELTAANDRVANNNSAFTEFEVVNNADASVSVLPRSASVRTGDPVDYTITIRSIRSAAVKTARVDLTPLGLNQVTYTPSAGTCTIFGNCQFGDLQPGATVTLAVHGVATSAGTYQHSIRLDSLNESQSNNNFATFDLTIGPSTNVSITGMAIATINIGATHTTQFVVRNTGGVRTATNVGVRLTSDFWAPIQTAAVTGGTCVVDSGYLANCQLGDMAVDDVRTVTVTVLGASNGFSQVSGRVSADQDDKFIDNDATNGIHIRSPVDLRVVSIGGSTRIESREGTDHVPIYSESTIGAVDFVATVELPDSVRLTALAMPGTVCEVIDARHGRCTAAALAHQMNREVLITAIGDAPGVYLVRVAISATGDADTSDNSAEYNLQITPFADAGVTPISVPQYLFLGQVYEFETRLRTSYRDVPNVNFSVTYPVSVSVTAPVDLTGCVIQRSFDGRYDTLLCQMAVVPANTDRLLQFQLRALSAGDGGRVTVQAHASYDVNWDNNSSDVPVQVVEDSDVAVELSSTSVTAKVGTSLALPRITLRSTRATYGITLKVPIPNFATIRTVSSGWVCTGTTTLECGPYVLMPGTETSFDITLDANQAGTFTSRVEVTAANDTNAANNTVDIALTVNAITPPPSSPPPGGGSSGGGGGGGGRIDWLTALLLGLLLAHRVTQRIREPAMPGS